MPRRNLPNTLAKLSWNPNAARLDHCEMSSPRCPPHCDLKQAGNDQLPVRSIVTADRPVDLLSACRCDGRNDFSRGSIRRSPRFAATWIGLTSPAASSGRPRDCRPRSAPTPGLRGGARGACRPPEARRRVKSAEPSASSRPRLFLRNLAKKWAFPAVWCALRTLLGSHHRTARGNPSQAPQR